MTTPHANDNTRGGIIPRGLRRVDAARYLGISPSHFDKQVSAGTIPKPPERFGVTIWDRTALDGLFLAVLRSPQMIMMMTIGIKRAAAKT